ncbi:pro-opiomelanocortin-like [Archocentrus centrarchus]|uniref:pro-opiomelanocortin-like n=1 Tax=Archocentrus centrarchus TaxID=63155 RepID=UPI0011EA4CC9|nr:pro-opiomelanocortin-like [Archocentrus centrarchus]
MVCLCWLLVVVMAFVCIPGFESVCWDNSICKDLSSKARILDCIHLCMSVIQTEIPELSALAPNVNSDADADDNGGGDDFDDDNLLLRIILATLASDDKMPESDLKARSDERRSYTMEHFRWGKPSGLKMRESKLRARSNERRSYSMEHFRWGKPSGRKRRPVKVFASSLEGGSSSEGRFPFQTRRQLSSSEDGAEGDVDGGSNENQGWLRARDSTKSQIPLSLQERKDRTYKMSHFRWGSPPASKRNGGFVKLWEENPQGQLAKFFRNILVKDVERIMG